MPAIVLRYQSSPPTPRGRGLLAESLELIHRETIRTEYVKEVVKRGVGPDF